MGKRQRDWVIIIFKTESNQSPADTFIIQECQELIDPIMLHRHFKKAVMLYYEPGFFEKLFSSHNDNFDHYHSLHQYLHDGNAMKDARKI